MAYRKKTRTPRSRRPHHDGPGDHFADHRLAFGLFEGDSPLGPTSPLQLTLLQDLHEHLSGTIGKAISLAAV